MDLPHEPIVECLDNSSKRAPPLERREGHSSTITHITKLPSDPLYGLPAVEMHSGAEEQEFFVFIVQRHDGRSGLHFSSGLPYDQAVMTLRAQIMKRADLLRHPNVDHCNVRLVTRAVLRGAVRWERARDDRGADWLTGADLFFWPINPQTAPEEGELPEPFAWAAGEEAACSWEQAARLLQTDMDLEHVTYGVDAFAQVDFAKRDPWPRKMIKRGSLLPIDTAMSEYRIKQLCNGKGLAHDFPDRPAQPVMPQEQALDGTFSRACARQKGQARN